MAIAKIINVKGEVFAVNKEGVKRRLQNGDTLQEGEVLVTAPGSSAELDVGGGKAVTVPEQQTFTMDGSVGGQAKPDAASSALESAAAAQKVVQALASGDANALLEAEAAAAGLAGGGGNEGGSSFVQLLRIFEGVTPVSYEFGSFSQGTVNQPAPGVIPEVVTTPTTPQPPIAAIGIPVINPDGTPVLNQNGTPVISFAESAVANVHESLLPTGSQHSPEGQVELMLGQFRVTDPNGVDTLVSVTINTAVIPMADLVGAAARNITVGADNDNGNMIITNFNPTTGIADFTYQLAHETTNVANVNETVNFTLITTDGTLTSDVATITINIIDDFPTAYPDVNTVADNTSASGNVITGTESGSPTAGTDKLSADRPNNVTGVVAGSATGDLTNAATVGAGIAGAHGTLTLNGDGSYTYAVAPASQHLAWGVTQADTFSYTIKDLDGSFSTTTLTLTINGTDQPTVSIAVNPATVAEDGATNLTYTVTLSNPSAFDTTVTYGLTGTVTGSGVGADYTTTATGTMTIAAGATTGTFTVDPTPDALFEPNETVIATLTSASSNSVSLALGTNVATGTITNDDVQLVANPDNDITVYESALDLNKDGADLAAGTRTGTNPGSTAETDDTANTLVGSVTGGAPGSYSFMLVGGTPVSAGVTQLVGTYGVLQLDSIGTYTYTLTSQVTSTSGNDGANVETKESFSYQVTDSAGQTAISTISVNIVDDTPHIDSVQSAVVANQGGLIHGDIALTFGADGPANIGAMTVVGDNAGGNLNLHTSGNTVTAFVNNGGLDGDWFYTMTVNADGTYDFSYTDRPVTVTPVDFGTIGGSGSAETITVNNVAGFSLLLNGLLYQQNPDLSFSLHDYPSTEVDNIKPQGSGFGIGDSHTAQTRMDNNEGFSLTVSGGDSTAAIGIQFGVAQQGSGSSFDINWRVYDQQGAGRILLGESGDTPDHFDLANSQDVQTFAIDPSEIDGHAGYVEVWFTDMSGSNVRIQDFGLTESVIPSDQPLNFSVQAQDGDGDLSNIGSFGVLLTGGGGPDYTVAGQDGVNEVIAGGSGSDTMSGRTGADTFQWSLADVNTAPVPVDHVTDFGLGGTDKLDLRDLLPDGQTAVQLDAYLDFIVTAGTTTINVKTNGTTVDQQIVLEGYNVYTDLGLAVGAVDVVIITAMKDAGKLITD